MNLNNVILVDRQNRPGVLDRVGLIAYFVNNGRYYDPYQISSVTIFRPEDNYYPSSVIAWNNEIDYTAYLDKSLMGYCNVSSETSTTSFDPSNFPTSILGQQSENSIYRISQGKYAVVLNGQVGNQVGYLNLSDAPGFSTAGRDITNACSNTGDYIDVWTIRWTADSDLTTIVNSFSLYQDRMHVLTEPIMMRTHHRLVNNRVQLGSKINLKVSIEKTAENPNLDETIRNLFVASVVDSPMIEITKLNIDRNLPSRVTVSSYGDTSSLVNITSDDTLIFNWDTSLLTSHPRLLDGTFGSLTGTYDVRVKYTLFEETIISPPMAFIVQ